MNFAYQTVYSLCIKFVVHQTQFKESFIMYHVSHLLTEYFQTVELKLEHFLRLVSIVYILTSLK